MKKSASEPGSVLPCEPGGNDRDVASPTPPHKRAVWSWFGEELEELAVLAAQLRKSFPQSVAFLRSWDRQCAALAASSPSTTLWAEQALDDLATQLRKACLRVANLYAVRVYRSPPDHQMPRTSEEHLLDFGYERDIRPAELEARIAASAIPAPGWDGAHLLFSSGQSALHAILIAARRAVGARAPCALRHLGSYFETHDLIGLLAEAGLFDITTGGDDDPNLVIYEPVHCTPEGQGTATTDRATFERLCRQGVLRVIICDTTLCRQRFDYARLLALAAGIEPSPLVIMFRSGLKLDQGGLELANVGIVSIFGRPERSVTGLSRFFTELRRIRTLTDSGLRFEDINALGVPWFLGEASHQYADRIFANNAELARSYQGADGKGLCHPALQEGDSVAPFCLLLGQRADPASYGRLEEEIEGEAKRRGILLQRGGSFGFRGHRYQAIIPKAGQPFIRLALGARRDHSSIAIREMLEEMRW